MLLETSLGINQRREKCIIVMRHMEDELLRQATNAVESSHAHPTRQDINRKADFYLREQWWSRFDEQNRNRRDVGVSNQYDPRRIGSSLV